MAGLIRNRIEEEDGQYNGQGNEKLYIAGGRTIQ
jgi:hypothetical protein